MYDTDRSAGRNDFLVDRRFICGSATYLINPYSRLKDLVVAQTNVCCHSLSVLYTCPTLLLLRARLQLLTGNNNGRSCTPSLHGTVSKSRTDRYCYLI